MEILVPADLNFLSTVQFAAMLGTLPHDDKYILDFKRLGNTDPFGMLLFGAALRQLHRRKWPRSTFMAINHNGKTYPSHMGFFKSFFLPYGNDVGEAKGSSRYIPITRLKVKDISDESSDNFEPIQEAIERRSSHLAKMLAGGEGNPLHEVLTYSIREIMRNIAEHSDAKEIWFAAQAWPQLDLVEIALLDEGIGVEATLKRNPNLLIRQPSDALKLAIEPGVSGKVFKVNGRLNAPKDETGWQNSGFGLYMTSGICSMGGTFAICSGNVAMLMSGDTQTFHPTQCQGTSIRMRIRPSRISNVRNMLVELSAAGEAKAKINAKLQPISASKVSKMPITSLPEAPPVIEDDPFPY